MGMVYPDKVAQEILEKIGGYSPIDLHKIAKLYNLSISYEELDEEISGMLVGKKGLICVNKNHPLTRQRFSIAHELGHYFLHAKDCLESTVFIDEAIYYRNEESSGGNNLQEIQANAFAAELLMPKNLLKNKINDYDLLNDLVIEKLAKEFDVSIRAMTIRLIKLKFITLY